MMATLRRVGFPDSAGVADHGGQGGTPRNGQKARQGPMRGPSPRSAKTYGSVSGAMLTPWISPP
jgi:hypothetical protein